MQHGKEGSYHGSFLREGEVRVCCEGGRGEGRLNVVPEGLGRFEGDWRRGVCRGEEGENGLPHMGFPDRV